MNVHEIIEVFRNGLMHAHLFGTGVVHRLDVLSGGMVESLPRQRVEGGCYSSMMSICAAREWASIVPGMGRF